MRPGVKTPGPAGGFNPWAPMPCYRGERQEPSCAWETEERPLVADRSSRP